MIYHRNILILKVYLNKNQLCKDYYNDKNHRRWEHLFVNLCSHPFLTHLVAADVTLIPCDWPRNRQARPARLWHFLPAAHTHALEAGAAQTDTGYANLLQPSRNVFKIT
jgi:hypothetical protein